MFFRLEYTTGRIGSIREKAGADGPKRFSVGFHADSLSGGLNPCFISYQKFEYPSAHRFFNLACECRVQEPGTYQLYPPSRASIRQQLQRKQGSQKAVCWSALSYLPHSVYSFP